MASVNWEKPGVEHVCHVPLEGVMSRNCQVPIPFGASNIDHIVLSGMDLFRYRVLRSISKAPPGAKELITEERAVVFLVRSVHPSHAGLHGKRLLVRGPRNLSTESGRRSIRIQEVFHRHFRGIDPPDDAALLVYTGWNHSIYPNELPAAGFAIPHSMSACRALVQNLVPLDLKPMDLKPTDLKRGVTVVCYAKEYYEMSPALEFEEPREGPQSVAQPIFGLAARAALMSDPDLFKHAKQRVLRDLNMKVKVLGRRLSGEE